MTLFLTIFLRISHLNSMTPLFMKHQITEQVLRNTTTKRPTWRLNYPEIITAHMHLYTWSENFLATTTFLRTGCSLLPLLHRHVTMHLYKKKKKHLLCNAAHNCTNIEQIFQNKAFNKLARLLQPIINQNIFLLRCCKQTTI